MAITFSDRQTPLYVQAATFLRRRIEDGTWRAGAQLPTLENLMVELGLGRVTVRQAMDLLEGDGLIERWRGKGTFVSQTLKKPLAISLTASWEALLEGLEGVTPRLLYSEAGGQLPGFARQMAEEERSSIGRGYRRIARVHERENIPYLLIEIYLDMDIYQRAPKQFDAELIIPLINDMADIQITSVRQVLTIGTADLETANHLSIPVNAPVGHMQRVMKDEKTQIIYAARLTYRGDLVRLDMNVDPPQIMKTISKENTS